VGAWVAGRSEFSKSKAGAAHGDWTNGIYVHHGAAFFKVSFWAILSSLGREGGTTNE
jgi:hypothetical protein